MQILPININSTTFSGRADADKIKPLVVKIRNRDIEQLCDVAYGTNRIPKGQFEDLQNLAKQLWQDICSAMNNFHDDTVLTTCKDGRNLKLKNSLLGSEIIISGEERQYYLPESDYIGSLSQMQEFLKPLMNPKSTSTYFLERELYDIAIRNLKLNANSVNKYTLQKLKNQINNILEYKKQRNIQDKNNSRKSLMAYVMRCFKENEITAANRNLANHYKQMEL